jgi:2-polyprenyl-6-methoxyphenol hydroxylase-like FAD-dependent oxidoreductase
VQVDPEVGRNDTGNFLFINLQTLEPKFKIPPNERRRVNREKLRKVLLEGVKEHVYWSKRLHSIEPAADEKDGVTAVFEDGTRAAGALIVGAEGSNSRTRKYLRPDAYKNTQLPVRFIGSAVDMTPAQVKPFRDLDPLLFQGCHPTTGTFLWVSMLESPAVNGTMGTEQERYRVQINVSWPVSTADDEVKDSNAGRMAQMKSRAVGFAPCLKEAVDVIPDDSEIMEIVLADWPCLDWNGHGICTLVGDAAHAMTMYRGEAANHGMLDAYRLTKALAKLHSGELSQQGAIDMYEEEMRDRTSTAVLLSRQACLDAHDWDGLNENSAVLKRRAISSV